MLPLRVLLVASLDHRLQFWIRLNRKILHYVQLLHDLIWGILERLSLTTWDLAFFQSILAPLPQLRIFLQFLLLLDLPGDEVLLEKRSSAAEVVIKEFDAFCHVAELNIEADLVTCGSQLLKGIELVFDIHLIQEVAHMEAILIIIWVQISFSILRISHILHHKTSSHLLKSWMTALLLYRWLGEWNV